MGNLTLTTRLVIFVTFSLGLFRTNETTIVLRKNLNLLIQMKHLKVIAKITMEISTMNLLILLHVVNESGEEIFNGG